MSESGSPKLIRILIADDHALIRKGLHALIKTEPSMEIIGEATNGVDSVRMALSTDPDVILLDLMMPKLSGIEAIIQIKQQNPQARILVLTSFTDGDQVFPAVKAGALGYILKDSAPQELIEAIRSVYQGESFLTPSIAHKLIQEMHQPPTKNDDTSTAEMLTDREREVLELVAQGLSNQDIASELNITERTARNHVGHILEKLHLANRTQAALFALRKGLASLEI